MRSAGSNGNRRRPCTFIRTNSLMLATLGVGREEVQEIQAKRAAEVRRKLSSASRVLGDSEELSGPASRVERRSYQSESRGGEEDSFGRHFSAKA